MVTILQDVTGFDIWSKLLEIGGMVSVLLAIGLIVVWRDAKAKDAEIKAKDDAITLLNKESREDARESIKVMTSIEMLVDAIHDTLGASEKRIIDNIDVQTKSVKELIHAYKEKASDRAH